MKTDSPGYDDAFKALAMAHLDRCDSLIEAFGQAAVAFGGESPPSRKEARALKDKVERSLSAFKTSLKELPGALGNVTGNN